MWVQVQYNGNLEGFHTILLLFLKLVFIVLWNGVNLLTLHSGGRWYYFLVHGGHRNWQMSSMFKSFLTKNPVENDFWRIVNSETKFNSIIFLKILKNMKF